MEGFALVVAAVALSGVGSGESKDGDDRMANPKRIEKKFDQAL